MNVKIYNKKGKKTDKSIKLDDSVFKIQVNKNLLANAVYVYMNNQREANAHSKDRSEVSGGGKKPWKQKGTGRARHGSSRSPIWTGGGVTFGPSNERNFKKKLNRKALKQSIRNAFSLKNEAKQIIVIDEFNPEKTSEVAAVLKNLGLDGKVTFVQVEEKGLHKNTRNMKNVEALRVGELNVYDILNSQNIVITKEAVEEISNRWGLLKAGKPPKIGKTPKAGKPAKTDK